MAKPITARMQAFADEWLTGRVSGKRFNNIEAARVAGYNVDGPNPSQQGTRLLRHPAVKAYIDKRMRENSMSAAEVLARFTEIARAQVGDIVKINEHGRLDIDAEKVIEYKQYIKNFGFDANGVPKIEFYDAHQALRDIARVLGMMKDGLEVSGPGGGSVPVAMTVQFVNPDGSTTTVAPEAPEEEEETEDFSDLE